MLKLVFAVFLKHECIPFFRYLKNIDDCMRSHNGSNDTLDPSSFVILQYL